ncbi:MAG: amino acid ABC transporter ATP-binding protein [Ruminococcaceae bacterium]|nr:amino acid ABC transporter ATP-binding protein [Oscillospiraceae bacterium]
MPILEAKNIVKNFGKTQVLKGIDFSMEKGEVVAVIGSSGSGKTTLLRCLNFLEDADKGQIFVEGKCIYDTEAEKKLTAAQIRENQLLFGLVFQSFNLFPQYSAFENVTLAPKMLAKERADFKHNKKQIYAEIEENARGLLSRVGLSDRMDNYPCQLSGGQQQRVSIARALALNPKVLFFDEPTSALDPELTGEILKVIRDLASKDVTMVIVTHEIEFARNVADRIIFMADGVVLEDGTPEEVLDNPKNAKTRAFLQKLSEN